MSVDGWNVFFRPDVRNGGQTFVIKGKVSLSRFSDTEIQAYIRASPGFKVSFKSESISSRTVTVDCTCPASQRGQFCKHIWATLLVIQEKNSEFLESKVDLQKRPSSKPLIQKQKKTDPRKQAQRSPTYSEEIERALKYFLENGFALRDSLDKEAIGFAKKKLARIFHPDKGGSHAEILELNKYADTLEKFSRS